jgi:hypothetical protein
MDTLSMNWLRRTRIRNPWTSKVTRCRHTLLRSMPVESRPNRPELKLEEAQLALDAFYAARQEEDSVGPQDGLDSA